ncbi:aminopeptidase [Amedibacillus sp. YH-ame6]
MSFELLKDLCNADSIASKEEEVRGLLRNVWKEYSDEVFYDTLGSMIAKKKGVDDNSLNIMFCAHMDEVGFEVRHISDIGFLYLIAIGGVQDRSKHMQKVKVTTQSGKKIYGILNAVMDGANIKDVYVDVGCETRAEVEALGIQIGDMVTFASEAFSMENEKIIAGKAMDDRSGCYVLSEALKRLQSLKHKHNVYMALTSSEEVGVRGGKLVAHKVQPDIVFAIDVANHPELDRGYTNHRKIGQGFMIVHYDKTLAVNEKLLEYVKSLANDLGLHFQSDMFSGGGTDAGNAHLEAGGRLAMVLGIPLRMCHGAYSLAHKDDINGVIEFILKFVQTIEKEDYISFINFTGGK